MPSMYWSRDGIKQEGGCEEDMVPFAAPFAFMPATPPTPKPPPDATRSPPIKGEGHPKCEVAAGSAHADESGGDGSGSEEASDDEIDECDVVLSLRHEKYKEMITSHWEKLWGESRNRKRDCPAPKDVAPKILDELKAATSKAGGKVYRMSKDNSCFEATDEEVALHKIQNDLRRGRQDYRKSLSFRRKSSSDRELEASDGKGEADITPALSLAVSPTSATSSTSPAALRDCDLLVSLRDEEYKQKIAQIVATFVDGRSHHPLTTVVSMQVKKVRGAGGTIFKQPTKRDHYTEVDDAGAIQKITADVRDKLTEARKNDARYIVVHKKNERYLGAIVGAAKALSKERTSKPSAVSKAEEMSKTVLEEFKSMGALHFFKNAVDEDEIPCSEALEKIVKDIQVEARSLGEPAASESEGDDDGAPTLSLAGSAESSASPIAPRDCDLVVSLRDEKYQKKIAKVVRIFVDGRSNRPLTTVVSKQIRKVRRAGGRIFKLSKRDQYTEVDDEGATKKIRTDARDKLTEARKNDARYVVCNKKNERYFEAIMGAAKALAKERMSKSTAVPKAEEMSKTVLEEFKSIGALHFFKNAVDEDEIPCNEALEKIVKDIQTEARSLHTSTKLLHIKHGRKEGILSSTRTRRNLCKSTIHDTPREFMSYYVRDLLHDHPEWTVKRIVRNGLDDTIATCQRSGGPCKLVGLSEILDDAYLSGFYEAHVVETEEGRGILELAGVLNEPESIFSDDLRRERHRRKQMNMGCEDDVESSSPTGRMETLESETRSRNLSTRNSEINTAYTVTKPSHVLGQRNKNIVLSLNDQAYRAIMYDHFRDMEKNSTSSTTANKVGKAILENFKMQLQKSGGIFLKKKGAGFDPADEEEALQKITQDLYDRSHRWRNDSRKAQEGGNETKGKAQEGGKCDKRNFSDYHEGVSAPSKTQKLSHNGKMEKEQENEEQEQEDKEQRDGNKDSKQGNLSCQPAAARETTPSSESIQDNGREERPAACISAQRSKEAPNNPIILLDLDDSLSESEPVTIKDEEADQSVDKPKMTVFGDSRAEIREIFKGILQSFNGAQVDNDAAGIEFFGHLKQFLELKADRKEFNLGDDAKIITQAVEGFKADKEEINANPSIPFFKSCLIATIDEAKKKLPLP